MFRLQRPATICNNPLIPEAFGWSIFASGRDRRDNNRYRWISGTRALEWVSAGPVSRYRDFSSGRMPGTAHSHDYFPRSVHFREAEYYDYLTCGKYDRLTGAFYGVCLQSSGYVGIYSVDGAKLLGVVPLLTQETDTGKYLENCTNEESRGGRLFALSGNQRTRCSNNVLNPPPTGPVRGQLGPPGARRAVGFTVSHPVAVTFQVVPRTPTNRVYATLGERWRLGTSFHWERCLRVRRRPHQCRAVYCHRPRQERTCPLVERGHTGRRVGQWNVTPTSCISSL